VRVLVLGLKKSVVDSRQRTGLMHRSKKGRGEEDKDDNLESP
jgi:hypothetical protein